MGTGSRYQTATKNAALLQRLRRFHPGTSAACRGS